MSVVKSAEAPPPKTGRPGWRTWAYRLGAVGLGLIVGLVLVEIAIRVMARADLLPAYMNAPLSQVSLLPWGDEVIMPPPLLQPSSYFGFVSRPVEHYHAKFGEAVLDITTMNWLDPHSYVGFRVPSRDWQPRWPVDAVVVGDSFSFCYTQYADCWVERLQSDYGLSVVDLGISATGSVSHLRVLDTFGLGYKPRIVVWQWYANDSMDDTDLKQMSRDSGSTPGREPGMCSAMSPAVHWLNTKSAIEAIALDRVCASAPEMVNRYHVQSGQVDLYFGASGIQASLDNRTKAVQRGWAMSQDAIAKAHTLAQENGAAFVIVIIPTKEETYRRLTEPYLGADGEAVFSQGRLLLADFCKAQGLTCFDATPTLVEHADLNEQIYWGTDDHLNPAGNRILAEAVDKFLAAPGLIK